MNTSFYADFDALGYAIVPDILTGDECDLLIGAMSENAHDSASRRGSIYARRDVLEIETVRAVAQSEPVHRVVQTILGEHCAVVRGLMFDKTPEANWKVPWHQDLTIAVKEEREAPGFGPWSQKEGVTHVQPPTEILRRIVALRLHLDECNRENGPLRVLPQSHRSDKLSAAQIQEWRERETAHTCEVPRGGALLMRPLLLHASSAATSPRHRRVLHLEWAAEKLPHGLEWFAQI
ncbi:MAG TPA: phytanoyl-CoA dioxygenase family protein [Abditibacteriaceae bacterium]|jgi:ectoine hydroxylase-related dioxygenase (phytanoyl-CoA dioxygenase family)